MFDIPKRLSLPVQAATAIRTGIADGAWKDYLPSERRLCEMFHVSRPTIRTALHLLAKDGLIKIQQGRRNRLLAKSPRTTERRPHVVGLVTNEPISHLSLSAYHGISQMRAHLAEQGFATEILICQPGGLRAQQRKLEAFIQQNRIFCCLLLSVNKGIQQWFASKSLPALVLGSCHPAVRLPSLDVDYRSVCRHAVGVLAAKSHRCIALIVPNSGVAGDLASEQGFKEGAEQRVGHEKIKALIVRHNGVAQSITAKLDSLFKLSHPPTALVVAKTGHVLAVILYLLKRGLAVPDTISLIARDQDHHFESVHPAIAHYQVNITNFEHRLSRLMLKLVNQGSLPVEPQLIFPKYFPGGTVKQLQG